MRFVFCNDILNRKNAFRVKADESIKENCSLLYKRSKNGYQESVRFMEACSICPEMCTNYIKELFNIKNQYPDDKVIKNIWNNQILPKVYIESFPMSSDEKENLQIKKNKVCDRILENHNKIQESYDIINFTKKYGKFPEFVMNKVCESVDKFKLPNHGKVVVALEEFYYMMESNGYDYDNTNIGRIPVAYFYHNENPGTVLEESFYKSISIPFEESWLQTRNTLDEKFFRLREGILSIKNNQEAHKFIVESVAKIMRDSSVMITDLSTLESTVNEITNCLKENIKYESTLYDSNEMSRRFVETDKMITHRIIEPLEEVSNILYYDYNIKCMNTSVLSESKEEISLNEFKLFKFNNILNAINKIDKFLGKKLNNVKDRTLQRVKDIKKKIFTESVYDVITEDGSVDCNFYTFYIEGCIDKPVHKLFTNICGAINSSVLLNSDYKCYYIATENMITLHLRSDDRISITESEAEELNQYISEEDLSMMGTIVAYGELYDTLKDYPITEEKITEFFDSHIDDTETVRAFIELCSYCIDYNEINSAFQHIQSIREDFDDLNMVYEYDLRNYNEQSSLPLEIQLEAYCNLTDILYEEAKPIETKKKSIVKNKITDNKITNKKLSDNEKENNKKVEKDNKNQKQNTSTNQKEDINSDKVGGINFNSIKLVLAGLKKKAKDLGAKEQELSRNVDVTFNNFVKACKNTLISDRREAIIKGSLIPSFSKCIKLAITVAGIAYINVGAAVIAVFGGLAMSKRLTNKERALLLDDIEVEIEVLDKEISMAESKNQMKKLRTLMRTKKDLQRQYQRIKYGMRVGKDILPSSNYKTPGGDK